VAAASHAAFVVRVVADGEGGVRGVVICVRTGERMAFRGASDAADVLIRAIASEMPGARTGERVEPTPRDDDEPGRAQGADEV
jgi:hypothetical protein